MRPCSVRLKDFRYWQKRYSRVDGVFSAQVNFLVTGVHILIWQEQRCAKESIAEKRAVVLPGYEVAAQSAPKRRRW